MKCEFTPMTYVEGGRRNEALAVAWPEVERILGREHAGTPEDDAWLVADLLLAGAPAWVIGATGWTDPVDGWCLIGPPMADPEDDDGAEEVAS